MGVAIIAWLTIAIGFCLLIAFAPVIGDTIARISETKAAKKRK